MRLPLVVTMALSVCGCTAITAESPLTISLDVPRETAERALHDHQFCRASHDPPQDQEVYPRCDRAGTEWGDSWVMARYDGDKLVELRRFERYSDDAHAVERWNQLVADRAKLTPESPETAQRLRERGLLEPGTRSVKTFQVGASTIVGVYLLQPSPPENAAVLERIWSITLAGAR